MGCINSKPKPAERRLSRKGSLDKHATRANSLRIEDSGRRRDGLSTVDCRSDAKVRLIDSERDGRSNRFYDDQIEKKPVNPELSFTGPIVLGRVPSDVVHPNWGAVPKAAESEQLAAGWPNWLVSVAGEALVGWVPRRANTFEKLEKIGQGTYSSVYKARDLVHNKLVALKKVRFDMNDLESVKFMAREIVILRRLDHPNIIKLEGLITAPVSCSLYLVFEYMDHDLVGLASLPGVKLSEPQVKCFVRQLLSGLDHCHSRGVLHRDIKGSNLLIDDNGILKIADFGLATIFDHDHNVQLTSRVITLWYRPPELLLGATHYGAGIDLWSTGCILGELYANKPILPGKTEVEQLHKIFKLCGSPPEDYWRKLKLPPSTVFRPAHPYRRCVVETFKDFPDPVIGLMDTLLAIDPDHRGTAATALKSEFFTTEPFACDPSSLPKYPPSKEIDAKMREEVRRQRAAGEQAEKADLETRRSKEPQRVPALRANASLTSTMRRESTDVKNRSDIFYSYNEDRNSGYPVDHLTQTHMAKDVNKELTDQQMKFFYSGPLVDNPNFVRANHGREHIQSRTAASRGNLTSAALQGSRHLSYADRAERRSRSQPAVYPPAIGRGTYYQGDSIPKQVRTHNAETHADYHQNQSGRMSVREPIQYGPKGSRIYVSGPLLVQPNKVDQMLEEHDRQLQEFARQARRQDQAKHCRGRA